MENWLKSLLKGAVAVVVIVFGWGIAWQKGTDFVNTVQSNGSRLDKLEQEIKVFKVNLGDLGSTEYEMELASDGGAALCEIGSAVVGIVREGQRIIVRCASIGRAAWNPSSDHQNSVDPNLYLVKTSSAPRPEAQVQPSPQLLINDRSAAAARN
jgi:hypothetical protein